MRNQKTARLEPQLEPRPSSAQLLDHALQRRKIDRCLARFLGNAETAAEVDDACLSKARGSTPEKFYFTVWDDKVAEKLNLAMGKRVSLQYEQKVGIPTSCFGETRYYVTDVRVIETIPLTPGTVVPQSEASAKTLQPVSAPPKTLP